MCILNGTRGVCYFYWIIFLKKNLKSQIQPPLIQKQKNEEIRVTGLGGSGPTGRSSKHFSTKPGRQISAQGSPSDGKAETGPRALAKARPTNLGGPFPLRSVLRPSCRLGRRQRWPDSEVPPTLGARGSAPLPSRASRS